MHSKILLFKNIFDAPDKERNKWITPGVLYLASALKEAGFKVILSNLKISLDEEEFITHKEQLERILKENADIKFIGISLCEDFFEKARQLVRFLRNRTNAFIGVGGVMPTLTPQHVAMHLPEINFLIRGAGEEVFPRLVNILRDKGLNSRLTSKDTEALRNLEGVIFRNRTVSINASSDKINKLTDYDRSLLDFSFINKQELSEGLNLFTSRGCSNNCFFCTTPGRGEYVGKSFRNLKMILRDYSRRLKEIFKDGVPPYAFKLSFNDDDFLSDAERANLFFRYIKKQPFRINFFQTGINSFFSRKNGKYTDTLNHKLIRSLNPEAFSPDKHNIYIGTENFSDEELKRWGKGYGFYRVEKAVKALSEKKIYQIHHFIASDQLTTPEDLLDNLFKIAALRLLYGEYFSILIPIIPYLVSLYPSASYRICLANKRQKFLNIRRVLSVKGHPEYDYPLVQNDIPINKIVRQLILTVQSLFLNEKNYTRILDKAMFQLLLLQERLPSEKAQIQQLVGRYKNYPRMIYRKTGVQIGNDRNNLQLVITRRCHLRCKYCPIVKKDKDMSEEVLYRAIDFLFTSSKSNLRLDFTGGEPLLRFDLVEKAVKYAKKLAYRKNKVVSFYLVTNLIALNDEMANFLKKENFFLELSVDGEEKFHNLYKVSKDRRLNPYRLTIPKLNSIFLRKIDNYAVMVVNPLTTKSLGRNFYHLLRLGFRKIGINYALGLPWGQGERREFFCQLDLIKARFRLFIEKGLIKLSNLESRVEPAILNSEIMIDTDGKVHFLTDWLFERKMKKKVPSLGQVDDFKNLNDIFLSRFRMLHRLLEYCPSTEIRKIIFNNIEMGDSVREHFKGWEKK
ncbi:MAG: radical SAM protein [Candidatus Aminicenantes bacterium]|nr:radical SAM protein [Candidatus Aminicenantes bacterium]